MRLRPVTLVVIFALGLLATPLPTEAQQAGKVYRVSYLTGGGRGGWRTVDVLRQRLRELGYVDGQNLVIEPRSVPPKPGTLRARASKAAAELVRLKVDVIVTSGAPGVIHGAKGATRTIPIVMIGVIVDPVEDGLVDSLARPGGNITGLYILDFKLHGKRLELLKEAFPQISRVFILMPPSRHKHVMKEVEAVGQALGIQIQPLEVSSRLGLEGLESALSAISREHPDGFLVAFASSYDATPFYARMIEFAVKRRLPTIYSRSQFVKEGGLMSYGANLPDMFRRTATYVDKILKGTNPADLPVERPWKFDLVINLKTAKALDITIPPTILYQATEVIR